MKTEAVMCIALTRHRPSFTPLRLTSFSTVGVTLMNPRLPGTSNQRCSVSDFKPLMLRPQILRLFKPEPGLLEFLIGKQPDEGLVVKINDLDAIAPRIAKVAAERRDEFDLILRRQLLSDLRDLVFVTDHDTEMFY